MTPVMQLIMSDIPDPILYEAAREILNWPEKSFPRKNLRFIMSKRKPIRIKNIDTTSAAEIETEKAFLRLARSHELSCIGYVDDNGKVTEYDSDDSENEYDNDKINFYTYYRFSKDMVILDTDFKKAKGFMTYRYLSLDTMLDNIETEISIFVKKLKIFYNACSKQSYESLSEVDKFKLTYIFDNMNIHIKRYLFGF
jgi:hypothetical protein